MMGLFWSIFTTALELILSKISKKIQFASPRRQPPQSGGLPRRKIFFTF